MFLETLEKGESYKPYTHRLAYYGNYFLIELYSFWKLIKNNHSSANQIHSKIVINMLSIWLKFVWNTKNRKKKKRWEKEKKGVTSHVEYVTVLRGVATLTGEEEIFWTNCKF